ncbi:hypothetical protein FKM82_022002 [Ascaphus truei]
MQTCTKHDLDDLNTKLFSNHKAAFHAEIEQSVRDLREDLEQLQRTTDLENKILDVSIAQEKLTHEMVRLQTMGTIQDLCEYLPCLFGMLCFKMDRACGQGTCTRELPETLTFTCIIMPLKKLYQWPPVTGP